MEPMTSLLAPRIPDATDATHFIWRVIARSPPTNWGASSPRCVWSADMNTKASRWHRCCVTSGMRKVGALILLVLLGLSVGACGVGDEDYTPPETDDRNEKLGIICDATFAITGTFVAGTPARPAEVPTGCWPVGAWTFTATIAENACAAGPDGAQAVTVLPSYRFDVGRVDDGIGWVDTYLWAGDQTAVRRLKVSEGGGAPAR